MKDEEKLTFFKKLKYSIFDFDEYQDLAAEKILRTLGYIVILMIIFSIIVAGIYTYKFTETIQGVKQYISDNIETINFENNILIIEPKDTEKKVIIEQNESTTFKVIINTQGSEEEIQKSIKEINSGKNGILILKDKILMKNELLVKSYEYKYADLANKYQIDYLEKQEIIDFLSGESVRNLEIIFLCIIFIYVFVVYLSTILVDILVFSAMGYLMTLMAKIRMRYSAVYNIAAYAITLPVILNMLYFIVNSFTGFTIKYFEIMYSAITSIYIITAILMIKSDVIKKQIELAKIIQEQDRVREELKRKEEEEKQEADRERQKKEDEEKSKQEEDQNEDDSNNKKKKKKSRNENPDVNIGEQPEGNNV